jgi:hypothetical protein
VAVGAAIYAAYLDDRDVLGREIDVTIQKNIDLSINPSTNYNHMEYILNKKSQLDEDYILVNIISDGPIFRTVQVVEKQPLSLNRHFVLRILLPDYSNEEMIYRFYEYYKKISGDN